MQEALQHPYFNELPAPSQKCVIPGLFFGDAFSFHMNLHLPSFQYLHDLSAFDEYGAEPPYPKRSAKPPPMQRQQSRSDSRRRPPSQTYTGKRKGAPQ